MNLLNLLKEIGKYVQLEKLDLQIKRIKIENGDANLP